MICPTIGGELPITKELTVLDELMEKYRTIIETPPEKDWNESEKEFGYIILDIIETRYKNSKLKNVSLETIKISSNDFTRYIHYMQEIAKMRSKPGENPIKIAGEMLGVFCHKGKLERYSDGVYQLIKEGNLYKGLVSKLITS